MVKRKLPKSMRVKQPTLVEKHEGPDDNDLLIEESFAGGQHDLMLLGTMAKKHYLVDSAQLLAMAKDQPDFLIPGLIPSSAILMLAGKPGAKKSWIAYSLLLSIVQHKPWLGTMPAPAKRPRSALVLNFDNPAFELGRRFKRLGLQPDDRMHFHSVGLEMPPMGLPALLQLPLCIDPIIALTYILQPSIILIDSMRQAHTGDESNSDDMGRLMSCMRQLTHWGAAVLILHHTRKTPSEGADEDIDATRGSSAIPAALDGLIIADSDQIRWGKTRLWVPTETSMRFSVNDYGNETRVESPDSIIDRVLAAIEQAGEIGIQRVELSNALKMPFDTITPVLQTLVARGCVESGRTRIAGKQMRILKFIKHIQEIVL